jgi:hypothetical protein
MPESRPLGNTAKHIIEHDHEQDLKDIEDGLEVMRIAADLGHPALAEVGKRLALRNTGLVIASGAVLSDDLRRAQDAIIDMSLRAKNAHKSA